MNARLRVAVVMGASAAAIGWMFPARAEPTPIAGSIRGTVTAPGSAGRPLVVYIETAPRDAGPASGIKIEQRGTQFAPGAAVVVKGQTVEFPNMDKFYHNVFSPTPGVEFDLGLYRGGVSKSMTFTQPGEVQVFCNIHADMSAKILVLQNDLYALVGPDGSYVIGNVPPGSYTVASWSAAHVSQKQKAEVKPGATVKLSFTLKLREEEGSHLNKTGEQYGRYK